MKTLYKIFSIILFASLFYSCEKYDDYVEDFDYSIVYFGTQKPLRTIVAYDEMQIQVGVALGGRRENNQDEWIDFEIDTTMLQGTAAGFSPMPVQYYSLSNPTRMEIKKGSFLGTVDIVFNRNEFTSDVLAHQNTYAIPLRITNTSPGIDSVLVDHDSTIVVVKYISPIHGYYYNRRVLTQLDGVGAVDTTYVLSDKDLIKNDVWSFTTQGLYSVRVEGNLPSSTNKIVMDLALSPTDNTVALAPASGGTATITNGSGEYNPDKDEFYLSYEYTHNSIDYRSADTLILRQKPEKDLRFEEW